MVYEGYKVYGPYEGKDGRLRVVLVNISNRHDRKTVSYPKYVMERYLNRYLEPYETVDHIDTNPLNNEISNLQVLNRQCHAKLDVKRKVAMDFKCPLCGTDFTLVDKKLSSALQNRRKGKAGPFCSRSCAGKYGTMIQHNKIEPLSVKEIIPLYTTIKEHRRKMSLVKRTQPKGDE